MVKKLSCEKDCLRCLHHSFETLFESNSRVEEFCLAHYV